MGFDRGRRACGRLRRHPTPGLRASAGCKDDFGRLLALGLTVMIVGQALINISVALGLLPTKGIPHPSVSYGGSSSLVDLVAVGILFNISQQASRAT